MIARLRETLFSDQHGSLICFDADLVLQTTDLTDQRIALRCNSCLARTTFAAGWLVILVQISLIAPPQNVSLDADS
jgi:hypothetical protein